MALPPRPRLGTGGAARRSGRGGSGEPLARPARARARPGTGASEGSTPAGPAERRREGSVARPPELPAPVEADELGGPDRLGLRPAALEWAARSIPGSGGLRFPP